MFSIDTYDGESLFMCMEVYDNAVYEVLYALPERKWRKIDGQSGWVVPATKETVEYLGRFFKEGDDYTVSENANILLQFDQLNHLLDQAKANKRWQYLFNGEVSTYAVPSMLKPFDHQRVAVEAMAGAAYFGLLMEMGTGKTSCIVNELQLLALKMDADEMLRVIIVCPKSLTVNWEREFAKCMHGCINYSIATISGQRVGLEKLIELIRSPARLKVALVSYDSVAPYLQQLSMFKPNYITFDESHYLKNPESKRFKAAFGLSKEAAMRRILTGTPVSNNVLDVWPQFQILRPGCLGFATYSGFKKAYCNVDFSAGGYEKITGFKDVDKLKQNMSRMSFLVKKDQCLDLPEKLYDTVKVEMPETMREVYDKFSREFFVQLDTNIELSSEFIIVQMMKLAQICSGYVSANELKADTLYSDGTTEDEHWERKLMDIPGADAKLNLMIEDAMEVIKEGKLIIWSRFRPATEKIIERFRAEGVRCSPFYGGIKDSERQDIIDKFNNDDKYPVFVGNPKSGGVGLTLLGTKNLPCHTTFYYSNDFSFGSRSQSEDRNHRIGQHNAVLYRDYVYENSIEEFIVTRLLAKRDISDAVKNIGEIKNFLLGYKESL